MSKAPANKGIIGKKLGMTQIFNQDNGAAVPVTVIEAGPCAVIQKKTIDKEGYSAVQLGFVGYPEKKEKKIIKPKRGHFKKAGVAPKRHLKEFKLVNSEQLSVGDEIKAGTFTVGEKVDVTGMTKGRGFAGAVKRWGLSIQKKSHGGGPVHRHVGSIGANSDPSRIMKNKKMPGRYGHEKVTAQNLEVIKIDEANNLIAVRGAVPGPRGSIVFIRNTVKN